MQCPKCGKNSRVLDTRTAEKGNAIRRRRICTACGQRFTTFEKIEDMPLVVVKKSGRKELFDRSKVPSAWTGLKPYLWRLKKI